MNIGREQEVRSLFIRAQRAHEFLSDPARRAQYDEQFDTSSPWGSPPPPPPSYEIQPLYEFSVDRASLEPAITLPRMRRRLDPDLKRAIIFISVCAVLAVLLVLFAS